MMFSIEVKNNLKKWHETPETERDYCKGLTLLVKASGNRSYMFSIRNPKEKKDFIDYQLSKYIRFALSDDERQEVQKMDRQVKKIMKENLSLTLEKEENNHKGKRADHDSLPPEIQALYVENLDILHRMRDIHLKLRTMTAAYRQGTMKTKCIDAERYPFLKEIIDLDKKMHDNWYKYDHYKPDENQDEESSNIDENSDSEDDEG